MRHATARPPAQALPRVLLAGLVAAALALGTLGVLVATGAVAPWEADQGHLDPEVAPLGGPVSSSAPPPASGPAGPRVVLAAWDRARCRAWADGDEAVLRSLYVRGSVAARHDVALLRRWDAHGLRVTTMRMRLQRVQVEHADRRRLVLEVTDRLGPAVAVRTDDPSGPRYRMPRDPPSTRTLVLARNDGPWRMVSVSRDRRA